MMFYSPFVEVGLAVLIGVAIVCRSIDMYWKIRGFFKRR